jgi:RNA polymerase-binding transcription factor DksA
LGTIHVVDARPDIIDEAIAVLDDVDSALVRLSEGSYRSCEVCGAELSDEALIAAPTTRRCEEHHAAPPSTPSG